MLVMKFLLRCCGRNSLLGPPDHWFRCACSSELRFSRVLHSTEQTNKTSGSAVLSETSNLPPKYETKAVTQLERLNFDDPMQAYRSKTSWEIARALLVLKLCSVNFLVERNMQMMKIGRKVLGKRLFNRLMKLSFYGHFVAGEDQELIKPTIQNMEKFGVGSILDYSVEEDISEDKVQDSFRDQDETSAADTTDEHAKYQPHSKFADRRINVYSARTYFYEGESECDKKMETFINCIDAAGYASKDGFAAIKLTALGRPQILMRVSQILKQTQRFFDQLAADSLVKNKIGYSVAKEKFFEGLKRIGVEMSSDEADRIFDLIDTDKSGSVDAIEWHEFLTPQLQLSKLFRARPDGDEQGRPIISVLTDQELGEFNNMRERLEALAAHAEKKGVRLMVDAEQSYFQPAIRRLTLDVQRSFNKSRPLIFNTYQCYLKAAYIDAETDMELARREGFMFGAKLVRGAYMEQERERASTLEYEDPVHPSYDRTSRCYNEVLNAILEETKRGRANVMVASHNEESVRFAVQRMHELGLQPDDRKVFFGQLLGMCDQISFTLGQRKYAVYKYVPYGPVEEVMPYLSRRAMENRGFLKGVLKERRMLFSELCRRIQNGELFYKPALTSSQ